jgi:hypothetical protein
MQRRSDLLALVASVISAGAVALYLALKPSAYEGIYLTAALAVISAMMAAIARGWPRVFCSTVAVESGAASFGLSISPSMLRHLTFAACCPSDPASMTFMVIMLALAPIQAYALVRSIL